MHTSTSPIARRLMRASLRRLHSPDIQDLSTYQPESPTDFSFLLQVFAGSEASESEESFDVIVCTPRWLERKHDHSDVVPGYHHLIVFEYDYDRIVRAIELLCESAEGNSWLDVAKRLSRFARWEFDEYTE